MAFDVDEFLGNLTYGGQRPALFEIYLTQLPTGVQNGFGEASDFRFFARASQYPASTLTTIETTYFGRNVKFPGVKQYDTWTVTVINDEDFKYYRAFQVWSNMIDHPVTNVRTPTTGGVPSIGGPTSEAAYKAVGSIIPFSKDGPNRPLDIQYDMVGIWPSEVSSTDVDWSNADALMEFTVTFAYDYWVFGGEGDEGQTTIRPART